MNIILANPTPKVLMGDDLVGGDVFLLDGHGVFCKCDGAYHASTLDIVLLNNIIGTVSDSTGCTLCINLKSGVLYAIADDLEIQPLKMTLTEDK